MMDADSPNAGTAGHGLFYGRGSWILLASLLINFFLLGLIVEPLLHRHGPPPFMGPHEHMVEHLTRGLPPEDADIIRETLRQESPAIDESRLKSDQSMLEMMGVLQQPAVNEKSLQKALGDIAAAHAELDEAMNRLITQAAAKLSPEGRRHFAASLLPPPGMPMPPDGMPFHPEGGPGHGDDYRQPPE